MLSHIDSAILKELDRQLIKSDVISIVMNKLDNEDKKNKFLSYMIDNRNVLITQKELFDELKIIKNYNGVDIYEI